MGEKKNVFSCKHDRGWRLPAEEQLRDAAAQGKITLRIAAPGEERAGAEGRRKSRCSLEHPSPPIEHLRGLDK